MDRAARLALFALQLNCDEETGEFTGGTHNGKEETATARLARICGWYSEAAAYAALATLEKHRMIHRSGHGKRRRLFVVLSGSLLHAGEFPRCEICGEERQKIRGAKTCAACLQGPVRRGWKAQALEIWRLGKLRGDTDSAIVYAAHNKVRRVDADGVKHAIPLWGRSEEGVAGSGSGAGESLVAAMIEMGLLDESWATVARHGRRGEEGGEE